MEEEDLTKEESKTPDAPVHMLHDEIDLAAPEESPHSAEAAQLQGSIAVDLAENAGKKDLFMVRVRLKQGEDSHGGFAVVRKTSEFEVLRALLVLHWPGVMIPPIPRSKRFEDLMERKDEDETIEKKRGLFEIFLQRVMKIPYLFNSEAMEKFLHTSGEYEKAIVHLKEVTFMEICSKYVNTFLQYMQDPDPEQPIILDHYTQVFKEALTKLESFKKVAKSMKGYFKCFMEMNEKLADCFETYEADCVSEFAKTERGNYRPVFKRVRKPEFENPYISIFNWAKTEELEFRAILEVFEVRSKLIDEQSKYESKIRSGTNSIEKLQAGKFTLGSLLTLRSKTEVLNELEIEVKWVTCMQDNDQLAAINKLIVCVTSRFIDFEIPSFKVERIRSYKQLMKEFANTSISELEEMIKVAKAIGLSIV